MIFVKPVYKKRESHPSLESLCLKMSLAANLIAFSGVTRVRFTAAPGADQYHNNNNNNNNGLK